MGIALNILLSITCLNNMIQLCLWKWFMRATFVYKMFYYWYCQNVIVKTLPSAMRWKTNSFRWDGKNLWGLTSGNRLRRATAAPDAPVSGTPGWFTRLFMNRKLVGTARSRWGKYVLYSRTKCLGQSVSYKESGRKCSGQSLEQSVRAKYNKL